MAASQQALFMIGSAAAVTYTTWDPSNKAGTVTLSGGNLVTTGSKSVRSIISKSSDKWYWEVTIGDSSTSQVGVCNSSFTVTNYAGGDAWSAAYGKGGVIDVSAAAVVAGLATYTTGDIIGVALDATAGTVGFYKNNSLQTTLNVANDFFSGPYFAVIGGNLATTATTNFGATAFTYSPPSGYNAGLYT